MEQENWHSKSIEDVYKELDTSPGGLSKNDAKDRILKYGLNELVAKKGKSPFRLFLEQFTNFLVIILIVATIISAVLSEIIDATVIAIIVVLNAVIGFVQEFKAEKAIEALKEMSAPTTIVIRDNQEVEVQSKAIVPGDIIILETGDRVPADIRLFETRSIKVDESSLTGESIPVEKSESLLPAETILAERSNIAHSGTIITYGRGKGVVFGTGMKTEIGKIASMIQEEEIETPLQKKLGTLGKRLGLIVLILCGIVFAAGFIGGRDFIDMFLIAVGLAVAAIPEGLPAIVTMGLALGIQRMAKKKALIRKLTAVETLGCSTVICSDKTGTLTKNEMTVRKVYVNSKLYDISGRGYEPRGEVLLNGKKIKPLEVDEFNLLLNIGVLSSNSSLSYDPEKHKYFVTGDPTSGAVIVLAEKTGLTQNDLRSKNKELAEIPFDSDRRRITAIIETPEGVRRVYVTGALDAILELSSYYIENGKIEKLNIDKRKLIFEINEELANNALRVIAFGYRNLDSEKIDIESPDFEKNLIFVGLAGMMDPPREEVKEAIKIAKSAGIKPVMITGDYKNTGIAVAKELGIMLEDDLVLTGVELEKMDFEELKEIVSKVAVYARVSPRHKLQIVKALKSRDEVIAMTGDGVNDAPALKSADIGIAMGITGTDVSKEASDMVLADDNFSTIVSAVEEGRMVYENIKKVVKYLISTNFGEIMTIFVGVIIGLPLPVIAIQILWINLVTDGAPALALGVDPPDLDTMRRKPRDPRENILNKQTLTVALAYGAVMCVGTLGLFIYYLFIINGFSLPADDPALDLPRTIAFTTLMFFQMVSVFTFRSEYKSIIKEGPLRNKYLILAVALSIVLQLLVIYVPILQLAFRTTFLGPIEWGLIIPVTLSILVFSELYKKIRKPTA
jgi:Ca2+-transporting ATPase